MRAAIIEQLDLPRRLVRDQLVIETCSHAGFFSPEDSECRVCETRMECEWLSHNDELLGLSSMSTVALVEALETSVLYVDACITRNRHERTTCACELCRWLEQAEQLVAVIESPLGAGPEPASARHRQRIRKP